MFLQNISTSKVQFNINSLTNEALNPNNTKGAVDEFKNKLSMSIGELLYGLKEHEVTMALENIGAGKNGEAITAVGSLSAAYGISADEITGYIPTANDFELSPEMELLIQKLRELRVKTRDGIIDAVRSVGKIFGNDGVLKLLEEIKETQQDKGYSPFEAEFNI